MVYTTNSFSKIVNEAIKNSNTIHLQLINGFFYPTDSISRDILYEFHLDRIPEEKLDIWSPKLIRNGYKLAISDYTPKPKEYNSGYPTPFGSKIGGTPKPQKNPCTKCYLNGLCDSDECGRKRYKIFSKK